MASSPGAYGGGSSGSYAAESMASPEAAGSVAMDEDGASMKRATETEEEPDSGFDDSLQSGRLTAGVFDDALNPTTFAAFMNTMAQWNGTVSQFTEPFATIEVVDPDGRAAPGVAVRVRGGSATAEKILRSGTDGRVVIFPGRDAGSDGRLEVQLAQGQGGWQAIESGAKNVLATHRAAPQQIDALDLALVIDATGSMGDELEYIKVELRSIAASVARDFPGVEQRYALIVYRDIGDAYVSRHFDFTSDLKTLEKHLGKQRADGGGDYPEAMDAALADASDLRWRDDPATARMAFLVADAPPHDDRVEATMLATDRLRAQGVGVYPVAASGVAAEAEAVMRAAALASGGQYLFLTDDSGVGNSHEEPHIPCYAVEPLRQAMTRMVRSELAGTRVEADDRNATRVVGRSVAGVCQVMHRAG